MVAWVWERSESGKGKDLQRESMDMFFILIVVVFPWTGLLDLASKKQLNLNVNIKNIFSVSMCHAMFETYLY